MRGSLSLLSTSPAFPLEVNLMRSDRDGPMMTREREKKRGDAHVCVRVCACVFVKELVSAG
jgi:hypothetical protein